MQQSYDPAMRLVEVMRFHPPYAVRKLDEWRAANAARLAAIADEDLVIDVGRDLSGGDFARVRVAERHASLFSD
jgi:hypothetical protein